MLALALCMFGFEQSLQAESAYFVTRGSLVNIVVGILICAATFWTMAGHAGKIRTPTSYWWTLALFAYAYSTFWWLSEHYGTSHYQRWVDNLPYLATVLFMSSLLIQDAAGLRLALIATFVFSLALSIYLAFIGNWSGRGLEMAYAGRYTLQSSVLSLAQIGGYLAVIASLLQFERLKLWWLVKWAFVGLGLYVTFKTASRGQTIALLATVLVCAPISEGNFTRKSIVNGIVTLSAVALCLFVILPLVDTGRWQESALESGVALRVSMAESLWKAYLHSSFTTWIFGLGASASFPIAGFYIHNTPIEVLCEEGVIGLVLFVVALGIPVKRFFSALGLPIINPKVRKERNMLVVLFALLLFEFMLTNKQGTLYSAQNLFLFAILLQGRAEQMLTQKRSAPSRIP